MADNNHEGMKRCTKCGEWKPATAECFYGDKTGIAGLRARCKECDSDQKRKCRQKNRDHYLEYSREYRQKNRDHYLEYSREYYQKNKDRKLEHSREYYQKNKDRKLEHNREYRQTPAGRLSGSIERLRIKTGATIYVRDMTEEQKETLANQYVAIKTLEKTEKELLAASGKKRCTKCDMVLDYDCFHKNNKGYAGLLSICKDCQLKHNREYRQQKKQKKST